MAGDAGELKAVISAETSDFISKMNELAQKVGETADTATEKFNAMGESVEGINSILAKLGLGAGLTEIGNSAFEAAEQVEKLNAAFENLAGATDANIDQWNQIKALELHSLFDFEDTLGPAAKYMLELGTSTADTAKTMQALVDAASALKEGPQWIESVSGQLARMSDQATASSRMMKQLTQDGISGWTALAEYLNTDVAGAMDLVAQKQVSGKDVADAVTQYLGQRYAGAAQEVADSWKGSLHDIQEAGQGLEQSIGSAIEGLMGTLKPLLDDVAAGIQTVTTWFNNLSPPMKDAILSFGALLAAIAGVAGMVALLAPLATAATAVAVGVAALLAGLVAFAVWVDEHWEPIVKVVNQAWDGLTELWHGVWDALVAWFEGLIAGIEAVFEPFGVIVNGIRLIWNGLTALWSAEWNAVVALVKGAWGIIVGAAQDLWNTIKTVFGAIIEVISNLPGGDKLTGLADAWKQANAQMQANQSAAAATKQANEEAKAASIAAANQDEQAAKAAADAHAKAEASAKAAATAEKQRAAEAKAAAAEEKATLDAENKAYEQILAVSPQLAAEFKDSFGGAQKGAAQLEATFLTLAQHGVDLTGTFKQQVLQAAALAQAYKDLGVTSEAALENTATKADAAFEAVANSGNASAADIQAAADKVYAAHQKVADYMNADLTEAYKKGQLTADEYYADIAQRAQDTLTAAQTAASAGTGTIEAVAAAEKTLDDARVAQANQTATELETAYTALGQKTQFTLDETAAKFEDYAARVKAAEGGDTITAINAQIAALEAQKTALQNSGQPTQDLTDKIKALKQSVEDLKDPLTQVNDAMKTLGLQTTKDLTDKTNDYATAVAAVMQAQKDGNATAADVYAAQQKLYDQTNSMVTQLNQPYADALKQGKITQQQYWDQALQGATDFLAKVKQGGTDAPADLEKIHAAEQVVANYTTNDLNNAYKTFNLQSSQELTNFQTNAAAAFQKIKDDPNANGTQIQAAWVAATQAMYNAAAYQGGQITLDMANEYAQQKTDLANHLNWTVSQWQTTYDGVHSAIAGAFDSVVKDLVTDPKSFKNTMITLGQDLATAMIDGFIAPFKKAVSDFVSNELANLISGLTKATGLSSGFSSGSGGFKLPGGGGTGVSPGSGEVPAEGGDALGSLPSSPGDFGGETGAAGGAGGAGGAGTIFGQGASSIMSGISVVSGAITAVSSIISNFQMAHQTDILRSIELNTRLTAMFIGGLGDGGVQTWTNLTAQYTSKLMDYDTWIHDSWVELLGGKDTIIGYLGGGGWFHDYLVNGLGPQLDAMLDAINGLGDTINTGLQSLTVTINAQGITTKEAAQQLSDQIAKVLSQQMAGSSLRT